MLVLERHTVSTVMELAKASSVEQIVDKVLELPERQRLQILAPVIRKKKGQHKTVFDKIQKDGYVRVRVDGDIYDVTKRQSLRASNMILRS